MRIGSGDTTALLQGKYSKGFIRLISRLQRDEKPNHNALRSPIDACRTGAILERVMYMQLPDDYLFQVLAINKQFKILQSTLDFAILNNGDIESFIEMKALNAKSFLELKKIEGCNYLEFVKKKYKTYYNQVQQQLLVTGLQYATLRFVCYYSVNDEKNIQRKIQESDTIDIKISEDKEIQNKIIERVELIQKIIK